MRRGGEGERRFQLNRPTQYSVQTEQGLTSTASTMTVQALTDDFAVGAQNSFLKTNQIGVEPNLSTSHPHRLQQIQLLVVPFGSPANSGFLDLGQPFGTMPRGIDGGPATGNGPAAVQTVDRPPC